jgi:hypothetical protein
MVEQSLTLTPSSGSDSSNTWDISGECGRVHIKPTTATNEYDIAITDADGLEVWAKSGLIGEYKDDSKIVLKGIHTVSITNATVDEAITVKLLWHELMVGRR